MTALFMTNENPVTDFLCDQSLDACSAAFLFVHTGSTYCVAVVLFRVSLC